MTYVTVRELIDRLQECDPDAHVFMMQQPSWPFEVSISGLTIRSEIEMEEHEAEDECPECGNMLLIGPAGRMTCVQCGFTGEQVDLEDVDYGDFELDQWNSERKRGNDVFLLEGCQVAYGSKNAWNSAGHFG